MTDAILFLLLAGGRIAIGRDGLAACLLFWVAAFAGLIIFCALVAWLDRLTDRLAARLRWPA